jgi:hypothetical protein
MGGSSAKLGYLTEAKRFDLSGSSKAEYNSLSTGNAYGILCYMMANEVRL